MQCSLSLRSLRLSALAQGQVRHLCYPSLSLFSTQQRLSALHASRRSVCSTPRRLAPAAPSTATLSARDFADIAPQLLLRQSLQQYTELDNTLLGAELHPRENHVIITVDKFRQFCAQAHVVDPDAALANLTLAGVVVPLSGGELIHLRPVLYLETLELLSSSSTSSSTSSQGSLHSSDHKTKGSSDGTPAPGPSNAAVGAFLAEEVERRIAQLQQQEEEMAERLKPAIARAAKWRRSVWGGALLFAGTQLAVISRLTYFDLDWDIMEPVSYCITIGTALVFYVYYLCYNEEHTYEEFDQRFLPKKVRQYAPRDFDWKRYESVCAQLVDERAMLERVRKWADRH